MISRREVVPAKITVSRAAEVLNVSRVYAYTLIELGELRAERYGPKSTLVTRDSLLNLLRRRGSAVEIDGDNITIIKARVPLDLEKIKDFCVRWYVSEFALFGSVTRNDFRPDSDVDVLVTLEDNSPVTLFSLSKMKYELEEMFGREVDLISRSAVEMSRVNSRREEILTTAQVIYHAAA